jgi:hypothetical protein
MRTSRHRSRNVSPISTLDRRMLAMWVARRLMTSRFGCMLAKAAISSTLMMTTSGSEVSKEARLRTVFGPALAIAPPLMLKKHCAVGTEARCARILLGSLAAQLGVRHTQH